MIFHRCHWLYAEVSDGTMTRHSDGLRYRSFFYCTGCKALDPIPYQGTAN